MLVCLNLVFVVMFTWIDFCGALTEVYVEFLKGS